MTSPGKSNTTLRSVQSSRALRSGYVWRCIGAICAGAIVASAHAQDTDAASLFAPDFDKEHQYRSFTYGSLYAYVKKTYGTTNAYKDQRVKVFARAFVPNHGNVNPILNRIKFPPHLEPFRVIATGPVINIECVICERTYMMGDADNVLLGGLYGSLWDAATNKFNVYLAFRKPEQLSTYALTIAAKCLLGEDKKLDINPGCYVAASGTLGYEVANVKSSLRPFGPGEGKATIPYLLVDKIEIYRDEAWIRRELETFGSYALDGGKMLWRVYSAVPKK